MVEHDSVGKLPGLDHGSAVLPWSLLAVGLYYLAKFISKDFKRASIR